jgi:hypothetical protein
MFIENSRFGIVKSIDFVQFGERYSGREYRKKGLGKVWHFFLMGKFGRQQKCTQKVVVFGVVGMICFLPPFIAISSSNIL